MDLPKHTIIWVRRSNHIYAVGPTWWLMKGDKLYQVTETYAGTKLKNLLTFIVDEEPVSTAYDQELHNKLNSQARRLLP